MLNVFDVAQTLIDYVEKDYPEEIAIIAYYGSYAQGTATKRSDLDFFFIPATSKGFQASIQFIIDGISFDFWPISWERAERMASFQDEKTTIVADSKLLYVRSDEDRQRFVKLRDTISTMQSAENVQKMVEKAESELHNVYVHLYKMGRASDFENITFYRTEAHGVLTKVLQSLALLNRTYYTRGFGKNKGQILSLPLKPVHLEQLMETIMHSDLSTDILQACEKLTEETLKLVLDQKEKLYCASYPDRMKGFYEEIKGVLDKIITACETNDYDTAFFSAVHVQDVIAAFLFFAETGHWPCDLKIDSSSLDIYKRLGFPELVPMLNSHDLSQLQTAVERLSTLLKKHLRTKEVEINCFENIEQFTAFLKEREGSA
ncbi:kanamycin nucleotidyltransferase C-terminal domain-containing protein [Paenibacillus sp.]|jgi:predicted nucleotidyltransferase|uniref:kanamycin nucleotidyltransferase C-terminal domain-containing protein n=1 Tax=Paenibacillus sp. TaxID=58172 RepID=UPI0028267322|nr:kanamycin nucleotidyltransferase C-terminal domain-containing protein [Paenibacillus sp.]MDR0269685.1 nucleotidyltransferase domain-containing protein [Paenibacillus sp.]